VGHFVRHPSHPGWSVDGETGDAALAVFPRRAVEIEQAGRRAVVANPGAVMFYDPRTPYRRRAVDPCGDDCRYFALDARTWGEVIASCDPLFDGGRLFRAPRGPLRPEAAVRFHQLFRSLEGSDPVDELATVESLLAIALAVVSDAVGAPEPPHATAGDRRRSEAAHALEVVLSRRFREPLCLDELAAEVGLSPFHAARIFRRSTGTSLHQYRDRLRLNTALCALHAGVRLDALALDLGYASHSHLTERFTRWFGAPPSAVRASAGRARS
jgi:AraC-like DNA-binding protein